MLNDRALLMLVIEMKGHDVIDREEVMLTIDRMLLIEKSCCCHVK